MAKDDLNPRDGIIRPAFYQAQQQGVTSAGQEIINANAEVIQAFVHRQRDQVRLGNLDQHRVTFTSPDLDIEYHNSFGYETIRLTPYPVDVPPEPGVPLDQEFPSPFDVPDPQPPTVTTTTLCMLVLYKGDKLAAIPMSQLAGTPNFNPIYSANGVGSFSQPVLVGQYNVLGYGFIITDVDLSGGRLKTSTICTTRIFDAISLNGATTPIAISPSGGPKVLPQSGSQTILIYNTRCAISYTKGVFEINAINVNGEQGQAVDSSGTIYYGSEWNTSSLVGLTMLETSIDADVYAAKLATTTLQSSRFVPFYDVNYILYNDLHDTSSYQANVSLEQIQFATDPVTGKPLTYDTRSGSATFTNTATAIGTLVITPYVIANDPGLGPQYINLNNITEILGTGCYAMSTYGQPMSIPQMTQAFDDLPYYEWNQDDLGYEYVIPSGHVGVSYGGSLPRMCFDFMGNSLFLMDVVAATAMGLHTVTTISTQYFPGWGGNFWTGVSGTSYQTPLSFDPEEIGASGQTSEQIVSHSTIVPQNYGQQLAASPTPVPSYAQAEAWDENVLIQLDTPTPGPNGANGPTKRFTSSSSSNTVQTTNIVNYVDPYSGRFAWKSVTDDPVTTTSESSDIPAGPFYKAQTLSASYQFSIQWGNLHVTGSDDGEGHQTQGSIQALPFPPGMTGAPYAMVGQTNAAGGQSTFFATPYGQLAATGLSSANPTGWMHVSDATYVLQGFILDAKPYIYLNGSLVTTQLAAALSCATTDIAACYFDIELDTIKMLGGIEVH